MPVAHEQKHILLQNVAIGTMALVVHLQSDREILLAAELHAVQVVFLLTHRRIVAVPITVHEEVETVQAVQQPHRL